MFALRSIRIDNGLEVNVEIGDSYQHIRGTNTELFNKAHDEWEFKKDEMCYAFIVTHSGAYMPLWKDCYYWIVTENGQTFANVSEKKQN